MYEDDICRVAFAEAVMVRHLLALLPNDVAAQLDPSRLRRLSTEHVGTDGQRRRADMSWAVGIRGQQAEALLALEFQSAPNRRMTLRMAVYTALLLQEVAVRKADPTPCCPGCCRWWSIPVAAAGDRPR